jgi:hypothetical protein
MMAFQGSSFLLRGESDQGWACRGGEGREEDVPNALYRAVKGTEHAAPDSKVAA